MPQESADEEFARFARQSLLATPEQIEAARKLQTVGSELGTPMSLAAALLQQGVITGAQRDSVEQKLQKERETANRLGPYKLLRKIGEGGMGSVYLADDPEHNLRVAVKVLSRKYLKDYDFLNRFRREAQAAVQLNHVNIARAFSIGEDKGLPYYVMEYCEGESLRETLRREKHLSPEKATGFVLQVARGLQYAHDLGFIHRDIKPDNIMVGPQGVAKILDLGLTKNIEDVEVSFRTVSGIAVGTPHYIAPEQARNEREIDGRADIYSLGATFYHLVTGETPFHGSTSYEIITKHLTEQLPDPRDIRGDIPDAVVEVIRKMMAKKPSHRYKDCGVLLADLEMIAGGKALTTEALAPELSSIALPKARRNPGQRKSTVRRESGPPPANRRKQLAVLGALGGGVLAIVLAIIVKLNGDRPHPELPPKEGVAVAPSPAAPPVKPTPSPEELQESRAKRRLLDIQDVERWGRKSAEEIRLMYESFAKEFEGTATASKVAEKLKATALVPAPPPLPAPADPGPKPTPPPVAAPSAAFISEVNDAAWDRAFNLLGYVDPEKDIVAGTWKNGRLSSDGVPNARVEMPYQPPQEYDVRIMVTRIRGSDVTVILSRAGRSFLVPLTKGLTDGQMAIAIIRVRSTGVTAALDGTPITEDRNPPRDWELRSGASLGLGTVGTTKFEQFDVLEIRGEGIVGRKTPVAPAKVIDAPPVQKTFASHTDEAFKTVWNAIVDKKTALQKQTVVLNKPAIGDAPHTIKDITPKSLVLETQFSGGLVESVEKPEALPVETLSILMQKASLLPNGELRKSMALLFAGSNSFVMAYRELAKAKTEGAVVGEHYVLVAMEELSRATTIKTPQGRLAALNTLSAQRASVWPEDLRQQLAVLIASEEREVRRSEGILGWRYGDRLASAQRGGGGKDTEAAVLAALNWLARHQGSDGSWSAEGFQKQCVSNSCNGPGYASYDTGITALSLLAFLGAGYTPASKEEYPDPANPARVLKFGPVVKKGINWLLSQQDPEGCVGERGQKYMYNHLISAIALAEAYAMTSSPSLRVPAQKAIDFVVAAQNPGRGWRYSAKCGENDTSVTGWAVMALKSAEASDLGFPRTAYTDALNWLNEATDKGNPGNAYVVGYNQARTGKVFVPGKNEQFDHHPSMSAVSVVSRLFIEKRKSDPTLAAVSQLLTDFPEWKTNKIDSYYWYYASLALFQYDGPDGANWKKWNGFMKYALVPNQRTGQHGCRNGSWDPDVERWGSECGRVGETALNALTLETYYRYSPLGAAPKGK